MRLFILTLLSCLFAGPVHAGILCESPSGGLTPVATLAAGRTMTTACTKLRVTSSLNASMSNYSTAGVGTWNGPPVVVDKGGKINPTTKFTGLPYAQVGWFTTPQLDFNSASVVEIPAGTFTSGPITVNHPVKIYGAGRGKSILSFPALGASTAALKFTTSGVDLSGFSIQGPSSAVYVGEENGIYLYSTAGLNNYGATVRDVEAYHFGSAGVLAEYWGMVNVSDCYVHDNGYMGISGLSVTGMTVKGCTVSTSTPGTAGDAYGIVFSNRANQTVSSDFFATGNSIDNIQLWEGIDTHGGVRGVFSNNKVTNCLVGIAVTYDTSSTIPNPPDQVTVIGNVVEKGGALTTPGRAIIAAGHDGSYPATNISVVGNVVKSMGAANSYTGAIDVIYTDGCTVSNNTITNPVGTAINLYQNNTRILVTGNGIRGIQHGVANAAGIQVYSAGQTGRIADNYIDATAEYGIFGVQVNAGLELGKNTIVTSSTPILNIGLFGSGAESTGSVTNDTASIPAGGTAYFSITVAGAAVGDFVSVTSDSTLVNQNLTVTGEVGASNAVYVRLFNPTAGAIDPPSATYYAKVTKK